MSVLCECAGMTCVSMSVWVCVSVCGYMCVSVDVNVCICE